MDGVRWVLVFMLRQSAHKTTNNDGVNDGGDGGNKNGNSGTQETTARPRHHHQLATAERHRPLSSAP